MLLQIEDPTVPNKPNKIDIAIGIDLGTTHSLACYRDPETESLIDLTALVPSIVSLSEDAIVVGDPLSMAPPSDQLVLQSIKRLMGRSIDDLKTSALGDQFQDLTFHEDQTLLRIQTPQGALSAIDVSAELLKHLKKSAENHLKQKVTKAVITVPAYFDDAARSATKAAARLAGLDVLRLINEPTAAALAYGLDTGDKGLYGIYDLGGGTFDFSILKLHRGVFQVIATSGDGHLGGDDIDQALLTHLKIPLSKDALQKARQAKERLSTHDDVTLFGHTITKNDLSEIAKPFIDKTLSHCLQSCQDATLLPQDLDGIVLVGGSTKLTCVRTALTDLFSKPPLSSIDPDRAVARGAALQAHALTHGSDTLLMDVTPLSLGLEMVGGIVDRIIDRNTPLPVSKAKEFTTYQNNQTGLMLHIVQGERELVSDCRSLGRFNLLGIPPMVAGAARIKVIFKVDTDGLLSVTAQEETTGIQQSIDVKPSFGLSEEEMKHMILSSLEHAKEDVDARLLAESKVEANRFLEALLPALAKDRALLTDEEFSDLTCQLDALDQALTTSHRDTIETCVKNLEEVTTIFAERRMAQSIKKALEGKRIDAVQQALDL